MKTLKRLFANPIIRLFARAVLAALVYAIPEIQHAPNLDHTLLLSIAVGAGWAALEAITPINQLVGAFKTLEQLEPALHVLAPPTPVVPLTSSTPIPMGPVAVVPPDPPLPAA